MPRLHSQTCSTGDNVSSDKINDINDDFDDIFAKGDDRLRTYSSISLTPLNVDIGAGKAQVGTTFVNYAGGTDIAMTDDATNYIEINSSGTIVINTTAWNTTNAPLSIVVCAGGSIVSITDYRTQSFGGNITNADRISKDYTAGEAITAGNPIYIKQSDSFAYKCDADDPTKIGFIGFAENSVSGGSTVTVTIVGINSNQSGLTIGSIYYLSGTAGAISLTPGRQKIVVGRAMSATTITVKDVSLSFGGDGSDGALNVASGTTTLSTDTVYNYSSINVSAGATLAFTGANGGVYLNCSGNCVIDGTIELRNIVTNTKGIGGATSRDSLSGGSASIVITTENGGHGGRDGAGSLSGGYGGQGVTGAGGSAGTYPGGTGGDGAGGGGGGGGTGTTPGTNGTAGSANNGGAGGIGASGNGGANSGGGGGGGAGYNTGNGAIGGAGGASNGSNEAGDGGDGGESGANGGNGGNGGIGGGGSSSGTAGDGGDGGDGYSLGGDGGAGGANSSTGFGGGGGDGGNSNHGSGGAGGNGGSPSGLGGYGGDGYTGGDGGDGGNGNSSHANGGNGGLGGDGSCGSTFIALYIAGNLSFTGTINSQGGNGGSGGSGGSGNAGANGDGGDGNDGGAGGDGGDVIVLCRGTLTNTGTVNNRGGKGGYGGYGGYGGGSGSIGRPGNAGWDGRDGKKIIGILKDAKI